MKRIKRFLQNEDGVMVDIEALFLYPFTIFIIFWLIYMGLWMFQAVALQNYTQKVAVLASREVSYPGYIDMADGLTGGKTSVFGTSAIDWNIESNAKISVPRVTSGGRDGQKQTAIRPYRYLTSIGEESNILDSQQTTLQNLAREILGQNSMLAYSNITVQITPSNYFVSQSVKVKATESVPIPGLVKWLGFDGGTISCTAYASANDQDEFIRNTDLVFDFAETLAKKLNLDKDSGFGKAIEKVRSFMNKVNGV